MKTSFLLQEGLARGIRCGVGCLETLLPKGIYATSPQRSVVCLGRFDDHPQLSTLKLLLESLPDEDLLAGLRLARGRGRDDFPVGVFWGVILFTIALHHPSFVCCIEELKRKPALYRLLGIASIDYVPNNYNLSRFVDVLGQEPYLSKLCKVFDTQIERLVGSCLILASTPQPTPLR